MGCRKTKVHRIAPGAPIPKLKPDEYWCDGVHDRRNMTFKDLEVDALGNAPRTAPKAATYRTPRVSSMQ